MNKQKRLENEVLKLFTKKSVVTPAEINAVVGGNYASKYITFLKRYGHKFSTQKDGRKVIAYEHLGGDTTTTVPVVAPTPKKVVDTPTKPVIVKYKKDNVERTFGSSGALSSYAIDPDWDNM